MKITDHNMEALNRHLNEEADRLRDNAKRLDSLAKNIRSAVRVNDYTVHSFEYVVQESIDIITHRSNVHPQSIARVCASLAAEAAVEWAKANPNTD